MTKSNLTITETKNGISVKKKSNTMARRIANDYSYERTRENNADFGTAGKAASLLCDAFRPLMGAHISKDLMPRLHSLFFKVIEADPVNDRGHRQVASGKPEMLDRFEFNSGYALKLTLVKTNAATIDRATGTIKVDIASFSPAGLNKPKKATHFRLSLGGAAIDFESGRIIDAQTRGEYLAITKDPIAALSLTTNVEANSTHPLFAAISIEFFADEHGKMTSFRNREHDAVQMVAVSGKPQQS